MAQLIAVPLLLPAFWFPFRWPLATFLALPVLPLLWVVRWRATGRLVLRSGSEWPLVAVLITTCIATIPVFDAALAAPKVLGIALGAAALVALQNAAARRSVLDPALVALACLTIGLSLVGLIGSEWPTSQKIPVLDPVLRLLPAVLRGIVPHTTAGGINPNELAGDLALLLPVLPARIIVANKCGLGRPQYLLFWAATLLGSLVLMATQSRGALIGSGVGLIVLFLSARNVTWRDRKQVTVTLLAFGVLLGVIGIVAVVATFRGSLAGGVDSARSLDSFSGRIELWARSLQMLHDFALTGIGPGQFDPVLHLLYPIDLVTRDQFVPHAHNLYLAYAVELGVPGVIAFGTLVFVVLKNCVRAQEHPDPLVSSSGLGLFSGLIAFLIFGLTDAIAPGARGGLVLWILLGLGSAIGRVCQSDLQPDGRRKMVGWIGMRSAQSVIASLRYVLGEDVFERVRLVVVKIAE